MQFPNFPTDSLYKFMALSGIVIVILSAYFTENRLYDLHLQSIDLDVEQLLTKHKVDKIKEVSDDIGKFVAEAVADETEVGRCVWTADHHRCGGRGVDHPRQSPTPVSRLGDHDDHQWRLHRMAEAA